MGAGESFPFRLKEMPKAANPGLTVSGLGTDLDWVGGFTFSSNQAEAWIEITSALERRAGDAIRLLIARDIRNQGDSITSAAVEWSTAEIVSYPR
jgi:hypothetical protein